MTPPAETRGPGFLEIALSLLVYGVLVSLFFHNVVFGDRTVASAPHIAFTLPEGPYGLSAPLGPGARIPLYDPWGPGHIHEANFPYRDRAVRSGTLPLWHPHEACGNPYFAGLLPGLLFPPSYLMHLVPPTRGFDITFLARLVLAGWLMFLFLRVHGLSRPAAFLGGAAFLGSGYMVISLNLWNAGVECLLPGLLLALECLARRGRPGHVVLAVVMIFCVGVGGNPESSFLALALGGIYFLIRVVTAPRGARRIRLGYGVLAHAVAGLLAAPQLLPFLEFLRHSQHVHPPGAASLHASWLALPAWIAPGFYEEAMNWTASRRSLIFYTGALPPILACTALVCPGRRFLKFFCLGATILFGLWHYGAPGINVLSQLPVLSRINVLKYPAVYPGFLIAILCGVGFHHLTTTTAIRASKRLVLSAVMVGAVPAAFVLLWLGGHLSAHAPEGLNLGPAHATAPTLGLLPTFLAAVLLVSAVLAARPTWRGVGLFLLAVLVLFEIHTYVPREHYPKGGDPFRPPPFLAAVQGDRRTFRVFSPDRVLSPNTAGAYGLNDVRYAEALKITRYTRLIHKAFAFPDAHDYFPTEVSKRLEVPRRALSLLGVRYVFSQGDPVPLGLKRLDPGARSEFALKLADGGAVVSGEVSTPGEGGAVVRFQEMDPASSRLLARGAIHPGKTTKLRLAGKPDPGAPDERFYLLLPDLKKARVILESIHWGGRSLDLRLLEQCVQHQDAVFLEKVNALVFSGFSRIVYLPPLEAGRPGEAVLEARCTGAAGISVILTAARSRTLAEVRAGPGKKEKIHLDLRHLAGKDRVLGIESTGPNPAVFHHLRFDLEGLRFLGDFEGIQVWENEAALDRAFGVYNAEILSGEEAQLDRLLDPAFSLQDTVLLTSKPEGWSPPRTPPTHRPEIRWKHESASGAQVTLEVKFPARGLLVLHDNHYPGWKAYVDGEPAPLLRANYTFRAVAVPAGDHRVEFVFWPASLQYGLLLAAVGAGVLLLFFLAVFRRRRGLAA